MNVFVLMSKYFWLVSIIFTGINGLIFRNRAEKRIAEDPTLKDGYEALLRGYFLWMNVPWVVMGIGCTVGGVPSVWHYFRPQDGNPFVLTWFATVFLLWALGTYWLFLRGGAEMLARHPGLASFQIGFTRKELTSPTQIKALWLLLLAGGIAGVAMMWGTDIQPPRLP